MKGFCTTIIDACGRPSRSRSERENRQFSPVFRESGSRKTFAASAPRSMARSANTSASGRFQPKRLAPECGPVPRPPEKRSQEP